MIQPFGLRKQVSSKGSLHLYCADFCICLSSVTSKRECLIVFNYVYEAQDRCQHLLYCFLGLHIALMGY